MVSDLTSRGLRAVKRYFESLKMEKENLSYHLRASRPHIIVFRPVPALWARRFPFLAAGGIASSGFRPGTGFSRAASVPTRDHENFSIIPALESLSKEF